MIIIINNQKCSYEFSEFQNKKNQPEESNNNKQKNIHISIFSTIENVQSTIQLLLSSTSSSLLLLRSCGTKTAR